MPTAGKVVAELKFAFWIAMLTRRHDDRLWKPWIRIEFPNFVDTVPATCRSRLHVDLDDIRQLRNRIAHHEPIFGRDLEADYVRLRQIVAWRSGVTAAWMDREQGVTALLAARP